MHACMYVCIYVCICVYMCVCMYECRVYMHQNERIYEYMYIRLCIFIYVYTHMYMCMYIRIYSCVHVCLYIYIYICPNPSPSIRLGRSACVTCQGSESSHNTLCKSHCISSFLFIQIPHSKPHELDKFQKCRRSLILNKCPCLFYCKFRFYKPN